jgi:hypothetical protein
MLVARDLTTFSMRGKTFSRFSTFPDILTNSPVPFYYSIDGMNGLVSDGAPGCAQFFGLIPQASKGTNTADLALVGYYIAVGTNTNVNGFVTKNYNLFRYYIAPSNASTRIATWLTNSSGGASTLYTNIAADSEILARNACNFQLTFYGAAGTITNGVNYSNNTSFERRKIGMEYDFRISKKWGIEGFYNDFDFSSLNLNGIRPYYKPFGGTSVPVLKNLEFGLSLVTDFDKTKTATSDSTFRRSAFTSESGMWATSFDAGTYLVNTRLLTLTAYAQAASLIKNNSDSLDRFVKANNLNYGTGLGASVGISAQFRLIANILTLQARIERNWHGRNFIPQFFDIAYELDRDARIAQLARAEVGNGTFGRLDAQILNQITLTGALYVPDNVSITNPGMVQFNAQSPQLGPISIRATYIKSGLTNMGDAITLDERSQAFARISYNISKYFITGVEYRWTFARVEDGSFKATNFVSPFFALNIPFNLNSSSNPNSSVPRNR